MNPFILSIGGAILFSPICFPRSAIAMVPAQRPPIPALCVEPRPVLENNDKSKVFDIDSPAHLKMLIESKFIRSDRNPNIDKSDFIENDNFVENFKQIARSGHSLTINEQNLRSAVIDISKPEFPKTQAGLFAAQYEVLKTPEERLQYIFSESSNKEMCLHGEIGRIYKQMPNNIFENNRTSETRLDELREKFGVEHIKEEKTVVSLNFKSHQERANRPSANLITNTTQEGGPLAIEVGSTFFMDKEKAEENLRFRQLLQSNSNVSADELKEMFNQLKKSRETGSISQLNQELESGSTSQVNPEAASVSTTQMNPETESVLTNQINKETTRQRARLDYLPNIQK